MGNIKNMILISFLSVNYLYNSGVPSDYYLFRFHPELPRHYRGEMFLLDNRYQRAISNLTQNQDNEFITIFERMKYVVSRLSKNKTAQYNYQEAVTKYKNKLAELKKA